VAAWQWLGRGQDGHLPIMNSWLSENLHFVAKFLPKNVKYGIEIPHFGEMWWHN